MMNAKGKRSLPTFLAFSILALSGNLQPKARKGADLIIQKTNRTQVMGELIAVRKNSLLLLERESGADVTIDVSDIKMVKIKKSKAVWGAGLGFIAGVGAGALGTSIGWEIWSWAPEDTKTKYRIMAWVGASSGLLGMWIGSLIGGAYKTIQFDEKSDLVINWHLEQLRKKARIKNAQ